MVTAVSNILVSHHTFRTVPPHPFFVISHHTSRTVAPHPYFAKA